MTRREAESYVPPKYGRIRTIIVPDDGYPPVYVPLPYKQAKPRPSFCGSKKDKFERELIKIAKARGGSVTKVR